MSKFLVFTYYAGRPLGGMSDYLDSFDSINQALENVLPEPRALLMKSWKPIRCESFAKDFPNSRIRRTRITEAQLALQSPQRIPQLLDLSFRHVFLVFRAR